MAARNQKWNKSWRGRKTSLVVIAGKFLFIL